MPKKYLEFAESVHEEPMTKDTAGRERLTPNGQGPFIDSGFGSVPPEDKYDAGEMMQRARTSVETPHDVAVEGIPAHDPAERAANPVLRTKDVSPNSSR